LGFNIFKLTSEGKNMCYVKTNFLRVFGIVAFLLAAFSFSSHSFGMEKQEVETKIESVDVKEENTAGSKEELANLENTVEKYRKILGINALVKVVQDSGEYNGLMCSSLTSHTIILSLTNFSLLKSESKNDPKYYEALAILCHEMGHAKQRENSYFIEKSSALEENRMRLNNLPLFFRIYALINGSYGRLKREYDQKKYETEQDADAHIPNEKALLLAARDSFCLDHKELDSYFEALRKKKWSIRAILSPILSIRLIYFRFFMPPHAEIDFSQPMNEEYAQAWDEFHRRSEDYHPSFYRRAYSFNERLRKLEV
jgi:hypothetical protein